MLHRRGKRGRSLMSGRHVAAIGLASALVSSVVLTAISPSSMSDSSASAGSQGRSESALSVKTTVVSTTRVPGTRSPFHWPTHGQAAVAVRGIGFVAKSPREHPVPIASLTKMMTALVVLRDHPLALNARGPMLVIDRTDVADYANDVVAGDSTLKIALGEELDEHQLLEALLLPSADNIADLLATWDAGSLAAFVVKMNNEARALGLTETHYADASGVSRRSVSTAADQAVVESTLMGYAAARAIVRMQNARLPIAGVIPNYNPAVGSDGIVGVKSGWTAEAGACLATAAFRTVGGHTVLVESVTLGQLGDLSAPATIDESLLAYATGLLEPYEIFPSGNSVQLEETGGLITFATASLSVSGVAWPGLVLRNDIASRYNFADLAADRNRVGTVVGSYEVVAPWGVLASTPATLGTFSITQAATSSSTTTSGTSPAN